MKHTLLIAESGAMHPDGTFSLLRVGIDRVTGATLPIPLAGAAVMRFRADPSESGEHAWTMCVVDEDGKRVVPDIGGKFTVPERGGPGHFLIRFTIPFKAYGRYSFRLAVDNNYGDDWPFEVVAQPAKPVG